MKLRSDELAAQLKNERDDARKKAEHINDTYLAAYDDYCKAAYDYFDYLYSTKKKGK